jgi:hypothetical protein
VFWEGVLHSLRVCLDRLSCVKMAAFQYYLQSGKQKSRVSRGRHSCCFWSKILWRKRMCETLRCRDETSSSFVAKVCGEVFAYFHSVTLKRHSSCGIDCLVCQDELCQNDEHALEFALHLSRLFSAVSNSLDYQCTAHSFFPECLSNHCQGLHSTFPKICTKYDDVPVSDQSQNRIRPHTELKIKGRYKLSRPPSCMKLCTLTQGMLVLIIYRCIALLQLLYRWQHQSLKLQIPSHTHTHTHIYIYIYIYIC